MGQVARGKAFADMSTCQVVWQRCLFEVTVTGQFAPSYSADASVSRQHLPSRVPVSRSLRRKAVETSREVWRAFLKTDPGIDDIADALRRMTKHGAAADAFYRTMVAHHPHYPKLLQARGVDMGLAIGNTGHLPPSWRVSQTPPTCQGCC